VFCDCLDCQDQPAASDVAAYLSPANEAAAKQEPPPKALVICATGFVQADPAGAPTTSLDACSLPHLDKYTREGQLTVLATRAGPASDLQQLLGADTGATLQARWGGGAVAAASQPCNPPRRRAP